MFPGHLSLLLLRHVALLVHGDEGVALLDHDNMLFFLHLVEFKFVAEVAESLVIEVQNIVDAAVEDLQDLTGAEGRNKLDCPISQEVHLLLDLLQGILCRVLEAELNLFEFFEELL